MQNLTIYMYNIYTIHKKMDNHKYNIYKDIKKRVICADFQVSEFRAGGNIH